jgi:CubicO group peptidase (beta-lactamase class C family)
MKQSLFAASLDCLPKSISGSPLTPSLSPSDGERVAEGRVRGFHVTIRRFIPATVLAFTTALSTFADAPKLPGVGDTMQALIAKNEIAGAITVVVSKDKTVHLETTGFADVATKRPMTPETLFWIASMTKPVTGTAILMLQDEGKLNVADPVAKYLPEFANL